MNFKYLAMIALISTASALVTAGIVYFHGLPTILENIANQMHHER